MRNRPPQSTPTQPVGEDLSRFVTRDELTSILKAVEERYGVKIDSVKGAVEEAKEDTETLRSRLAGFVTSDRVRDVVGDVIGRVRTDETDTSLIDKIKRAVKDEGKERIVEKVTGEKPKEDEGLFSASLRDALIALALGAAGIGGWKAFAAKKVADIAIERIHNRIAPQPPTTPNERPG